jgi:hypothetical protein
MNIQQNTLGQILAAKSVAIQTEFRTYSADADESTAWLQLMAAGVRVAHALMEHIPGIVADLTAVDSRVYWVQEHQGRACLCSGSITKEDDPRDDVRLLEDIEGLSATELQEIAHNLEKWLSSPVFWHLGKEILDTEFRDVYGAST